MTKASADRIALVTGASRGIGAATAKALAGQGYHVVIVARTANELEEVEEAIHDFGGSATIAPLDIAEGESIAKLAQAVGDRWGHLDVLVLNAATLGTLAPVTAIDGKELNSVFTLNVLAQQAMIAVFDPLLRKSDAGRLVALTSSVGASPRAFWGAYGASKAALDTLVTCYGAETSNISKVRTAIVDPGATRTTMRARAYPGENPDSLKSPDVVASAIIDLLERGFDSTERVVVDQL